MSVIAKVGRTLSEPVLHFGDLAPRDFERLCLALLRHDGFENVEHIGASGSDQGCDLLAERAGVRWVCQCKRVARFGPRDAEREVEKVLAWPDSKRPRHLLFIVTSNVSRRTRERAAVKAGSISCHFWPSTDLDQRVRANHDILATFFALPTPVEITDTDHGFAIGAYLASIDELIQRDHIEDLSVRLAGELDAADGLRPVDPWDYLVGWALDDLAPNLALLGDYGSGKSWLSLRLTKHLADAFVAAPSVRPVPLLVSLRTYRATMDLDDLLSAALARDYGQAGNVARIRDALNRRQIVLILDGLDEMAKEPGQRDALVQFARLGVPPEGRALVTCRTPFFLSGAEQREVLNTDEGLRIGSKLGFDLLYLKPLGPQSIRDAIRRRVGIAAESRVTTFVRRTYNLQELCARPVLLDLVCRSYGALQTITETATSADLYQAYLDDWLTGELRSGRLRVHPDRVLRFLEELAELLVRRQSLWLSGAEFVTRIMEFAKRLELRSDEAQSLPRQLATSSVLRRVQGDNWEFGHRSFQEYLYARRFFRWEADSGAEGEFAVTHVPVWQFISQIVIREWTEQTARKWIPQTVRRDQEPSLCRTTLRAAAAYWLLRRGDRPASSYELRGVMLDCVDLRGLNLDGADLSDSDLNGSDLRGARLRGADLRGAILTSANLAGADLTGANLSDADLRYADCSKANFEGAMMLGASLAGASLVDATFGGT